MAIVEDIPDEPSTLRNRIPLKSPHAARQSTTKPLLDINEILRPDVIQEALDIAGRDGQEDVDYEDDEEGDEVRVPIARAGASEEVDERDDNEKWWDEVFDSLITTVPFVFLYLLLNILVHLQYQHRPTLDELVADMLKAIPTLGVLVFYTNRHSDSRVTISFLMAASILSGTRMIWLVNNAGWSMTTQQAPPIGTLWILTVVQLPLTRAVSCLGAVAGWTWYTGSAIMPK